MTSPANDREAAAELAKRIEHSLIEPSARDEARRPPSDRPPAFADALMAEKPRSVEGSLHLSAGDWALIARALQHYASAPTAR